MKHGEGHTIYMLGIGGIGMSALARYYRYKGYTVAGYDRTPSPLTQQLEDEGMAIHYEDRPDLLPDSIDFVVYTPAVPQDLKEFEALRQTNIKIMKRSEALGLVTEQHFTLGIAGTHGKTTTTAMVAHILHTCGKDATAFIGGIANNFNSNLLLGHDDDSIMVVEADEYDRSFLQLCPNVSIINSIDADHLDVYRERRFLVEAFNTFANQTKNLIIVKEGLEVEAKNMIRFGFDEACDYRAVINKSERGLIDFEIEHNEQKTKVALPMAGNHNVLNATAAFIAALQVGLKPEAIAEALSTFKGVKRRFDIHVNNERHCYIDDYAHHPEEIRSCLTAAKEAYRGKRITLVFQPHLFSRTRDLMDGFASALALADELILLDIYPAREEAANFPGVTSKALLDKVSLLDKCLCTKDALIDLIESKKPELLITMGAGDIDRFVEPLEKMIKTW